MPQKIYIKDQSFDPIYKSVNKRFFFKSKILSGTLMALGFLILTTQVIIPLVFFKTQDSVAKPVRESVLGMATGYNDFQYTELSNNETSFSDKTVNQEINVPKYFYITIPKLKIEEAIVETNSTNLSPDTSLGHYKGSALPGQKGNGFIYGHSVLTWFFNPKNYKTIFSTLENLTEGDEFTIQYNNKDYRYKVESKEIKKPEDVNPIAEFKPKYLNESTITLMTCYPSGTKLRRLMVYAVLVN